VSVYCIEAVQMVGGVENRMTNRRCLPTNCSYIEEQNEQRTEQLCAKVKILKHIVIRIGEETRSQNAELTVRIKSYRLIRLFFYDLEVSKIHGSNE
jgi:hypothetical protein